MSAGVLFLELLAMGTLIAFIAHGKRTHDRVEIARRPPVISDRPEPYDFVAEARSAAMAQHPAGKGREQ